MRDAVFTIIATNGKPYVYTYKYIWFGSYKIPLVDKHGDQYYTNVPKDIKKKELREVSFSCEGGTNITFESSKSLNPIKPTTLSDLL